MPKTPHSSWNWSSSRRRSFMGGGYRSHAPGATVTKGAWARYSLQDGRRERGPDRRCAHEAARALPEKACGAAAGLGRSEPPRHAQAAAGADAEQDLAGARSGAPAACRALEVGADRRRRGGGAAALFLEGVSRAAADQGHERLPLRDHLVEDGRAVGGSAAD